MIQPVSPAPPLRNQADFYPSLKNPAVALCTHVWETIHTATLDQTRNLYTARNCAAKAYRLAMPPLSGYRNICDFIACVGYGVLLGAIKDTTASKLLYAAQVALAAIPREAKTAPEAQIDPQISAPETPTPPPLSPQTPQNKRITPKKSVSTHPNKAVTAAPLHAAASQPAPTAAQG